MRGAHLHGFPDPKLRPNGPRVYWSLPARYSGDRLRSSFRGATNVTPAKSRRCFHPLAVGLTRNIPPVTLGWLPKKWAFGPGSHRVSTPRVTCVYKAVALVSGQSFFDFVVGQCGISHGAALDGGPRVGSR